MSLINSTSLSENGTAESGQTVGLSVGLTLFFLLLGGVVAGLVAYTQRRRLRSMWQPGKAKSKEDISQDVTGDASPKYHAMVRPRQSINQTPIYENFKGQPLDDDSPTVIDMGRPHELEEDLYLQCEAQDEPIYSNDPACSLSILPDTQEDDIYVVPDSL